MRLLLNAADGVSETPMLKVALYGFTGSGKTTWSARAPMPLFILTERQGLDSVRAANPSATVLMVESWKDFRQAWGYVKNAKRIVLSEKSGDKAGQVAAMTKIGTTNIAFQTLVVDSLTDLQTMLLGELGGVKGDKALQLNAKSKMSRDKWGRVAEILQSILRDQRSIPASTVFIMLASDKYDQDDLRRVEPMLAGKTKHEVGAYFNAVGLADVNQNSERGIIWMPHRSYATKQAPGFPRVTRPDCTLGSFLLARQDGKLTPSEPEDDAGLVVEFRESKSNDDQSSRGRRRKREEDEEESSEQNQEVE